MKNQHTVLSSKKNGISEMDEVGSFEGGVFEGGVFEF